MKTEQLKMIGQALFNLYPKDVGISGLVTTALTSLASGDINGCAEALQVIFFSLQSLFIIYYTTFFYYIILY